MLPARNCVTRVYMYSITYPFVYEHTSNDFYRSVHKINGSVWNHNAWARLVRLLTQWVFLDRRRTGKVLSFINTMGLCGPMTYGKGSFVHRTPWVCVDPWHTEKVRSFTEHHGSLWTHDVRKRFVHKTPWVPRDPWRMGSKYFQRIRCARSEMYIGKDWLIDWLVSAVSISDLSTSSLCSRRRIALYSLSLS